MTVSVVIPTFNSARCIGSVLDALLACDMPRGDMELIICDAGSTDETLGICRAKGVDAILPNPLKTGEAGKAVGVKAARNDVIALIDSDNVVPDAGWLRAMLEPFNEPGIAASEPIAYYCRPGDGYITRYCARLGMNDPLCLFLGNYDRVCGVTGKWTGLPVEAADRGSWLEVTLRKGPIPTIGANGTCFRRSFLLHYLKDGAYLNDIDILYDAVSEAGAVKIAKVKTGIIHIFAGTARVFARKQRRRIEDFLYYRKAGGRSYPWSALPKTGVAVFALCCVTVVPLVVQAVIGAVRAPDTCWLFHPVACWITLWCYGMGVVRSLFTSAPSDRSNWKQT